MTSDEIWDERQGDMSGTICTPTPCYYCVHRGPDCICKLSGKEEWDVLSERRKCPHRKAKSKKQMAMENAELDRAACLPEHEWREWLKEHEDWTFCC